MPHVSLLQHMCFVLLLVMAAYIKENRESLLESQISINFILFTTLNFDCYTSVRVCNLYSVMPKPGMKLLLI